jgi:hypothetical protein
MKNGGNPKWKSCWRRPSIASNWSSQECPKLINGVFKSFRK